jgi:hypothetical protein
MKHFCTIIMLTLASFGPVIVSAQDANTVLWRAINASSATLLPIYGGQPSPFLRSTAQDASTTVEAEAMRLARIRAMQQAEQVLNSPDALIPNLSGLNFAGRLIGAQGVKVFYNNQWLGLGSKLSAPIEISAAARNALSVLEQQDVQAAEELQRRLQNRLVAQGALKLTITAINDASVSLKSPKEVFEIPLQRSGL